MDLSAKENHVPMVFDFYGSLNYIPRKLSDQTGLDFSYNRNFFNLIADFSFKNDGKYTPEEPYLLGHYISLNRRKIALNLNRVHFAGWRDIHRDIVSTPYYLFISSIDIASVLLDFTYSDKLFLYETRWIQINIRSKWYRNPDDTSLDLGANYKVYGLKFKNVRFDFQESTVYLDRSFDAEYFLNPIPQYLVQIVTTSEGKPWTREKNNNELMGFFFEWTKPKYYMYSQFLIDDLNLGFLVPKTEIKIPKKIAWSLGGCYQFPFVKLGFYHARATKYTFGATYARESYSDMP